MYSMWTASGAVYPVSGLSGESLRGQAAAPVRAEGAAMKSGRQREPRIIDPACHPRPDVCLRVAAAFLNVDPRTLKTRIVRGDLTAYIDGGVYRISVKRLAAYKRYHTDEGIDAA